MTTLMITHDVDDVQHWLKSPRREQLFGPLGMTVRTFVDGERSNHVGVLVEVSDLATFEQALGSAEAADAMKDDGVRPETLHVMVQA